MAGGGRQGGGGRLQRRRKLHRPLAAAAHDWAFGNWKSSCRDPVITGLSPLPESLFFQPLNRKTKQKRLLSHTFNCMVMQGRRTRSCLVQRCSAASTSTPTTCFEIGRKSVQTTSSTFLSIPTKCCQVPMMRNQEPEFSSAVLFCGAPRN
jgi:hypothetical protein